MFFKADSVTASFDNVAFLSRTDISFVQDMGDGLHATVGLDSAFVFDTGTDYSDPANRPIRWLAEGRDPSATIDSAFGGFGKNEGDNEITGLHVSDGDPTARGILGAKIPDLRDRGMALVLHAATW